MGRVCGRRRDVRDAALAGSVARRPRQPGETGRTLMAPVAANEFRGRVVDALSAGCAALSDGGAAHRKPLAGRDARA